MYQVINKIEPELVQLITNADGARFKDVENLSVDKDPVITSIAAYFQKMLKGIDGKADCPFIKTPLRDNAIFVRKSFHGPGDLDDSTPVITEMFRDFRTTHSHLDVTETDYDVFDPIIVIHAYPEGVGNERYAEALDDFKKNVHIDFIRTGRMLTQVHGFHPPIPGKLVGFNCEVPMLIGKRMNRPDERILSRSQFEQTQFNLRFKPIVESVCPYSKQKG